MACVLATQGLADLSQVDRDLPQQITQNTAVRLALRQGSAEDQEGWSALLGGAPISFGDSNFSHRDHAVAVSPDDLAMLRTGEAFLQVLPRTSDGTRKRLLMARPRKVGAIDTPQDTPDAYHTFNSEIPWLWPTHTEWRNGDAFTIESTPSSTVADHGSGPIDRRRSAALAAAHDTPDRVLVCSNSQMEAVEIELTPKRDRTEYDRKLTWYTSQLDFSCVHWFVPSASLRDRLRKVAQILRMEDMIHITPLPSDGSYPPGVVADHRRSSRPNR